MDMEGKTAIEYNCVHNITYYSDDSVYDNENDCWIEPTLDLDDDHYIYIISDINGSCYVGSTRLTLEKRHDLHKREIGNCGAKMIDLEHSVIDLLDICKKREKEDREYEWILIFNECVNFNKIKPPPFDKRQRTRIHKHFYKMKHGKEINNRQNCKREIHRIMNQEI